VIDFSILADVPDKIEGVALLDESTVVIANDNDFDIGEFDADGNNVGDGTKSQVLVIQLNPALAK
jgi:hypothetical protein